MKYMDIVRLNARVALAWSGDEAHRRFIVGAIVGGVSLACKFELDSTFVDCVVAMLIPALAAWSSRTPHIEVA